MPLLTEPLLALDTADNAHVIAMALDTSRAFRNGRTLRKAPISQLTATEPQDCWADDRIPTHNQTRITGWPQ
jgi:hypothetical protein